jgi:hypothetical protein
VRGNRAAPPPPARAAGRRDRATRRPVIDCAATVPSFCRHNRFIDRCPICRESLPDTAQTGASARRRSSGAGSRSAAAPVRESVRVRRETRAIDDGYRSNLVPGLRASADAARLADEIAFATARLERLAGDPPGLYAQVAAEPDREQALWAGFLIAYLCPTEGEAPFEGIAAALTDWSSGELPNLDGIALGPRTSHEPSRGDTTIVAYRAWAQRAGSQAQAFAGDADWSEERRFERVYERLALPGLGRAGRFELLLSLGALGIEALTPASLQLASDDGTVLAAKRVFGIGDRFNLERRAAALAEECEVPIGALDLALFNWSQPSGPGPAVGPPDAGARPGRATMGLPPDAGVDEDARARAQDALEIA